MFYSTYVDYVNTGKILKQICKENGKKKKKDEKFREIRGVYKPNK